MESSNITTVLPLLKIKLRDFGHHFATWWLNEFVNLIPEKVAQSLVHRARHVLILKTDDDIVTLDLKSCSRNLLESERVKLTNYSLTTIDHFLQARGLDRSEVDIAIGLPSEKLFCRKLTLPLDASNAIDDIVTQSLLKKTPFKLEDVYFDHVAIKANGEKKIAIWQWITQRKFVHDSLLQLKIDPESISLIVGPDNSVNRGEPPPIIKLRPSAQARKSRVQRSMFAMACTAVVLGLVAGGQRYWRQNIIVDDLQTQVANVRAKAQRVRELVDKLKEKQDALAHLRLRRSNAPGLIDLWAEATRILPSQTWITELRLTETQDRREQQAVFIGFSAAAPSLVGVIDGSPLFSDAALTAPVSLDPIEKVERFTLQAKVASRLAKASR